VLLTGPFGGLTDDPPAFSPRPPRTSPARAAAPRAAPPAGWAVVACGDYGRPRRADRGGPGHYFGVTVEDPYRWLEDAGGDEARGRLEGQAAHAPSVLDALGQRATLLARVAELRGGGSLSHPVGSVPANSDPDRRAWSRWVGRRW
jgi:hypothetical protein